MSLDHINSKKIRKSFGKIPLVTSLPNLIEVQKRSFDSFLQLGLKPSERLNSGLHAVFKSVFPINDYTERAIQNRVSQMQQMENIKIDVTVPGDVKRNVGDIITFDLDSVQAGERTEDKLYSGKYLVTSLRHSIKDDRHSMIMEVVKDSYFSSLPKGK